MTTKEFLSYNSKLGTIKMLKTLESENLIKNAFLLEVREALDNCYDNELRVKEDEVKSLLNLISSQIDGITQNSIELSNFSCNVNIACELIEDIKA